MRALSILGTTLFLSGCATVLTTETRYIPPAAYTVENFIKNNESVEVVWSRVIANAEENGFTVLEANPELGTLRMTFEFSEPEKWVDCGVTRRAGASYPTASTAQYPSPDPSFDKPVLRTTQLTGLANYLLRPAQQDQSETLINVLYSLDVKLTIESQSNQAVLNNFLEKWVEFSSQSDLNSPPNDEGVNCVSNGRLEEKILNFATQ